MIGKKTILIELSIEDLKSIICEAVAEEMSKLRHSENKISECLENEILSLKEVSKILNISLSTLNRLNKQKILENFKIGHKVFYRREDVIKRLK